MTFVATTEEFVAKEKASFKRDDKEEVLKLGGILGIVLACLFSSSLGCGLVLLWRRRGYQHGCRCSLPDWKSSDHSTEETVPSIVGSGSFRTYRLPEKRLI